MASKIKHNWRMPIKVVLVNLNKKVTSMNKFILVFVSTVLLLSCASDPEHKVNIVEEINQNISSNPSAAGGSGVNYYVCDDGDDANDGLDISTPWQTFSRGMQAFNSLNAGDAVLFCRGGHFTIDTEFQLYNFNCQVGNECIISDYIGYDNATALPIIEKSSGVLAAFYFKDPREADHEEGVIIENLNIIGPGDGYGVYIYNDVDDVLLKGLHISGFERGVFSGTGNTPADGADLINERLILDSVVFSENKRDIVGTVIVVGNPVDVSIPLVASILPVIDPTIALQNKTIYVCDDGSDDSDGLSPSSAWLSFSKAGGEFSTLNAGDTVAFCRGGVIEVPEYKRFININCQKEAPCVFRDYYKPNATGREPLPILKSTNDLGVFSITRRNETNAEGIVIKNLELIGNGAGKGVFVHNGVSHILLQNLLISNFRVAVDISRSVDYDSSNVSLVSSRIFDNGDQGWLGGCSNCLISDNDFENNGYFQAIRTHQIYFSGHDSDNVKIINNRMYKTAVIQGQCTAVALVVHGTVSNLLIKNNLIVEDMDGATPTCFGIGIGPGYDTEEWFKGVVISDNTIVNSGAVSIACGSCEDLSIMNNKIMHANQTYHAGIMVPQGKEDLIKSNRVTIQGNIITILGEKSQYVKAGIQLNDMDELVVTENVVEFDNTDYSCIIKDSIEMAGVNLCRMSK